MDIAMFETVIEDIKTRLEALRADRVAYEMQLRLQLAAFDGATQELEAMLKWYEERNAEYT